MKRKLSFEKAKALYVYRYTMDHVPVWAKKPCSAGKYYAPQYKSDLEWFENTVFPGEKGVHSTSTKCDTTNQSWPLGVWLDSPYSK